MSYFAVIEFWKILDSNRDRQLIVQYMRLNNQSRTIIISRAISVDHKSTEFRVGIKSRILRCFCCEIRVLIKFNYKLTSYTFILIKSFVYYIQFWNNFFFRQRTTILILEPLANEIRCLQNRCTRFCGAALEILVLRGTLSSGTKQNILRVLFFLFVN